MAIHTQILQFAERQPLAATLLGVFGISALLSFSLIAYFKPDGKRPLANGKSSKLPPGPRGVPLFGSLLDLKDNARDPGYGMVSTCGFYPCVGFT